MKHYFQLPNGVINDINRKGKSFVILNMSSFKSNLLKDNIHVGRNQAITIL